MKKETLKEVGKGFIAFGNLVGGLSIVHSLFGIAHNLPTMLTVSIVLYIVIICYISGAVLLNKGSD